MQENSRSKRNKPSEATEKTSLSSSSEYVMPVKICKTFDVKKEEKNFPCQKSSRKGSAKNLEKIETSIIKEAFKA